ncbi:MAG: aldehyde dehydrogenase family protein [Bacteriovoracia bacterium]
MTVQRNASDIARIFESQRAHHPTVKASPIGHRRERLEKLRAAIQRRAPEIREAIYRDFRKPAVEVDSTEIYTTLAEIDHTLRHLRTWTRPHRVPNSLALWGSRSEIRYEPKGVVLIISPWNYPFYLMMTPLISAIAAGNCCILKPSELTAHTSRFLASLIEEVFEEREVALFEGDAAISQHLLELPFDHIFFTGSTRVGKLVMQAAAKHLTPVTLELGGKSPAIVDESADLRLTCERIAWGKFVNAGQTCVAPDYVLLPESRTQEFLAEIQNVIARFYGSDEAAREKSPDFCRPVNDAHFSRLRKLTEDSLTAGARAVTGGVFRPETRYIAPTVLFPAQWDHPIMREEIFGPVLPVLTYRTLEEACARVRAGDKPLSLYVYASDRARIEQVLAQTSAGGTVINSALVHLSNAHLPFGGVGASGIGSCHGFFGFKAFSHERAVLFARRFSISNFLLPPYGPKVKRLVSLFLSIRLPF